MFINISDFQKIGGYSFITKLLESPHPGLQWRAADLLATMVQNNLTCQQGALEARMLPQLLDMVDTEEEEMVRVKALYAVSCKSDIGCQVISLFSYAFLTQ